MYVGWVMKINYCEFDIWNSKFIKKKKIDNLNFLEIFINVILKFILINLLFFFLKKEIKKIERIKEYKL